MQVLEKMIFASVIFDVNIYLHTFAAENFTFLLFKDLKTF